MSSTESQVSASFAKLSRNPLLRLNLQVLVIYTSGVDHPWGRNLVRLRKAKELATGERWPRARVAKVAKMTPTTYGKIELGGHTQTRKLEDLARVLDVTLADLFVAIDDSDARQTNTDIAPTSAIGHTMAPSLQPKVDQRHAHAPVSAEALRAFGQALVQAGATVAAAAAHLDAGSTTPGAHRPVAGAGKHKPHRRKRGA